MSGSVKAHSPLIAWLTLALLVSLSFGLNAQEFVYTNNDVIGPNSVSAFSIGSGGTLTPVAGSPFATGGTGSGGGFFASNRVSAAISGNFLYASNCGSNNVSGFSINAATGVLTPVPGSPFATGGICSGSGIAVAVTPDTRFLYATNPLSNNISAFSIAANGALSPISGSPFAAGGITDGTKVSPDGKYLAVAISNPVAQVAMFSIGLTGALTAVPGSPFLVGGAGGAAGVDINCASNLLFVGEATGGPATVSVQGIASNGALSPVAGSPFTFGGANSNVIVLSPDDLHAFVSNQVSNTITALDVASGGGLTQVAGSPFANPGGLIPSGMATNQAGTFLYVANVNNTVTGFSIAGNGALAPVPGSPFATGIPGLGLLSLAVFPPKSCVVSAPCPLAHGFWKTHPDTWPVTTLTLGGITYTQAQLLEILNTPVGSGKGADASLKLADQLIAALLDIAGGSDPLPIAATIADAQSLLLGCALPCGIEVPSALGQLVADAAVLVQYNSGLLTPGCTP